MKMDRSIKAGDTVEIEFWQPISQIVGVVLYKPVAVGDSWVIDTVDGIVHVQLFAVMRKIEGEAAQ